MKRTLGNSHSDRHQHLDCYCHHARHHQLHPGIGLPPRLAGISERPSHPLFAQSPRAPHSREPRAFRFGILKKEENIWRFEGFLVFLQWFIKKEIRLMCKYEEIEGWRLSNGKTIREINNAVHDEVERIYLEAWSKGISVPYFEGGKTFLANPDGSDDEVSLDFNTRQYTIIRQVAAPGKGKMSYLLQA